MIGFHDLLISFGVTSTQYWQHHHWLIVLLIVLAVWDVVWRGIALWQAARKRHEIWFVALLIINSVGILPIIYLLYQNMVDKKSA